MAEQFRARKSLGQHFLSDPSITGRIVQAAGGLSGVNVIEIGPGPGALTRALHESDAAALYAVEKDSRFIPALMQLSDRLQITEADALKIKLMDMVPPPRKIVANLPYNVGTLMLLNWLEDIYQHGAGAYQSMTLMFQKEVADRIAAPPGGKDYGRISVLAQWLCEVRKGFDIPPGAFSPPPKVSSTVITLTPRVAPLVPVTKKSVEKVVAAAFGQRRKMLRVALKTLGVPPEPLLAEAGIDPTRRAEQLDVTTLCRLAQVYEQSELTKAASSS
jgi:16S rRNA (adenine1518-N6/adenine1519-N6)-dimethyltransferase